MRPAFYILLTLILLTTCSIAGNKNSKGDIIKNLESKTPVVWPANCNNRFVWLGDYATQIDTLVLVDIITLHEKWVVTQKVRRFNKWILKDDEGNIYAEAFYRNDTLLSLKKFEGYITACDIDSICAFKLDCDTLSVTEFY